MSNDPRKPRIIKGVCEFCGVPAAECSHYRSGSFTPKQSPGFSIKPEEYDHSHIEGKLADIIIPHHDRHDHLKNCLDRLPNDIFNIIIVSGGTFAENCNKGARLAETENLIFLNDDTYPLVEYLVEMCQMPEDYVGAAQTHPNRDEVFYGISFLKREGSYHPHLTADLKRFDIPTGFLIRVKRHVWEDLQGFNERFRNGGEDSDFGLRAKQAGYSIGLLTKPTFHVHSQSTGRLIYHAENQQLLNEKWSTDNLDLLFNRKNEKLDILVATNHLAHLGGSETWTYTVVKELERLGHNVEVLTGQYGVVSDRLPVVACARPEYDLLLINHTSMVDLLKDVKGFKIQTCHGIYPALEQPVPDVNAHVAISEEVYAHVQSLGYRPYLIRNGVDLERFRPRRPIRSRLENVLCLCQGQTAVQTIKEACEKRDLNFRWRRNIWDIEDDMNWADLVVTLGRGAYEAMACGRAVLVYDARAYCDEAADGMFSPDMPYQTKEKILAHNFSGRGLKRSLSVDDICLTLQEYDPIMGEYNRKFAEENFDVKSNLQEYLKIYENNRNNQSTQ